MDRVQQRFDEIEWTYATGDPKALKELEERIAAAGRKRGLITYSDLVRGVTFDLPNLQKPRVIDVADWQEIDRAIVGDFLGYISKRSYEHARLFSSALVVSKMDGSPGEVLFAAEAARADLERPQHEGARSLGRACSEIAFLVREALRGCRVSRVSR